MRANVKILQVCPFADHVNQSVRNPYMRGVLDAESLYFCCLHFNHLAKLYARKHEQMTVSLLQFPFIVIV